MRSHHKSDDWSVLSVEEPISVATKQGSAAVPSEEMTMSPSVDPANSHEIQGIWVVSEDDRAVAAILGGYPFRTNS